MPDDVVLDETEALRTQLDAQHRGELLVWVVYQRPAEFPDRYIARPFLTRPVVKPLLCHLEAPTLEELRKQLPSDLAYLRRFEADDPVILETWV